MSGIGELLVIFIFGLLLTLPVLTFILLRTKGKKNIKQNSIILLLSTIPFISYSIYLNKGKTNYQKQYVGEYELSNYQDCDSCILSLMENGTYKVFNQLNEIESGEWNLEIGGDYWIIHIGENGQLGSGRYSFDRKKSTSKK